MKSTAVAHACKFSVLNSSVGERILDPISRREKRRKIDPYEKDPTILKTFLCTDEREFAYARYILYLHAEFFFSFFLILSPIERRFRLNVLLSSDCPVYYYVCLCALYVHADPSVKHTRVLKAAPKGRGVPRDRASNLIRNGATPALHEYICICTAYVRHRM